LKIINSGFSACNSLKKWLKSHLIFKVIESEEKHLQGLTGVKG